MGIKGIKSGVFLTKNESDHLDRYLDSRNHNKQIMNSNEYNKQLISNKKSLKKLALCLISYSNNLHILE